MHISEFDFDLPPELIAQEPVEPRDASRMLVIDRKNHNFRDGRFTEFPSFFVSGDVVVINNTRVFPARLLGRRIVNGEPGAQVEAFLVKKLNTDEWEVLAKPGRALREGALIEFGDGRLRGLVTAIVEEGRRQIRFECDGDFDQLVDEIGNTPLPPYIKREQQIQTRPQARLDEPRYQTVYAKQRGAIAAPTAGLHFTERVFDELRARGVEVVEITHHVGYATFQPVRVEQIEEHKIAAESYEISESAATAINRAHQAGNRVVAVGTTSVRALESAADENGRLRAGNNSTELFIYPGYRFRAVDSLLTNFHLPQSSLLMLVSAFAEKDFILQAYRHAVEQRYRFYSYGDCMLLV
ncbi:MAG TPA: tRNA preQ1(34) S-adenosylmethionine ribosyltransferase-isomerase QueA [Blastocatellia bacterium]|nr:tRNA preQ1(34) S-adenosylmethionine ribosyltransferase-isomerase QueA [Blastocatellia bacterium]HMX28459.1 tRNA preQ1(34) S-adenosylmethionine ribosyltransferase-isomerase QueA [Blastocatellia bacterium]HMY75836.1 tRNA preQ1(34) S-adenosylmethionine ribosyltransferase-isomerase QueA [Blastocatellia bacterium]HMZ23181.1 tRNA preQ1(34) S-adenosylmethionine ribosyltransferase-isomerase QueA [Blastocatellia bacterium]